MLYFVVVAPTYSDMIDDYGSRLEFKYGTKEEAIEKAVHFVGDQNCCVMIFSEEAREVK